MNRQDQPEVGFQLQPFLSLPTTTTVSCLYNYIDAWYISASCAAATTYFTIPWLLGSAQYIHILTLFTVYLADFVIFTGLLAIPTNFFGIDTKYYSLKTVWEIKTSYWWFRKKKTKNLKTERTVWIELIRHYILVIDGGSSFHVTNLILYFMSDVWNLKIHG